MTSFFLDRAVFRLLSLQLMFFITFCTAGGFLRAPEAMSQENDGAGEDDDKLEVKSQKGLLFNLPEDWPIQKNGATLGPIPIEQYLALKFDKANERIAELEARVKSLESKNEDKKIDKTKLISKEIVPDEQI